MDDLKETVESVHASITFDNGKKIEAELPKDEALEIFMAKRDKFWSEIGRLMKQELDKNL